MFKTSNFKSFLVAFTVVLCTVVACDDFDPATGLNGTQADVRTMLQTGDVTQRATISSDNFKFISNRGVKVSTPPNSFVSASTGDVVTGMIDFEMTELFTKSEILRYGIPTQTDDAILESDGEFLFAASQNGEGLRLASGSSLTVTVPNSEPNPDMQLFTAAEGTWWPLDSSLGVNASSDSSVVVGYDFELSRLSWVNIDYFTKFDRPLTDIDICVPDGYEVGTYVLWIVFQDIDVVLSTDGRNLPIGEDISVVCIAAEDDSTFRIDIEEVTIEEGLKVNLEPKRESAEKIIELLKELD